MEVGDAGEGLTAARRCDAMDQVAIGIRMLDLVIVVTLIEWAALVMLWRHSGRGVPPGVLTWILLPGLCLMLAARSVMIGAPWYWLALLLLSAGIAHLIDLRSRWRY